MGRGVSLSSICGYQWNPDSGSRLKCGQRSDMNRVQRSHGHGSLNDLFGPAQNRRTDLDQLPPHSVALNPDQRRSEVFFGHVPVAFSSA
jgi:hypothetical protein